MTKSKIKRLVENKKKYISSDTEKSLYLMIDCFDFNNFSEESFSNLFSIFNSIKSELSSDEERYLTEIFQKIFVEESSAFIIFCYNGVDLELLLTKQIGDNWGGYVVTAREDSSKLLLSETLLGDNNTTQTIFLNNIDLTSNLIYKIKIGLELGTEPTGDVERIVDSFYLLIKDYGADLIV
ncbi:hypothetical protein GW932_02955 [archaeon]|nr:hypothetical protein [archaeon]